MESESEEVMIGCFAWKANYLAILLSILDEGEEWEVSWLGTEVARATEVAANEDGAEAGLRSKWEGRGEEEMEAA